MPKPLAADLRVQGKLEPLVLDAIYVGEVDHYAIDNLGAHLLVNWAPQHRMADDLTHLVASYFTLALLSDHRRQLIILLVLPSFALLVAYD